MTVGALHLRAAARSTPSGSGDARESDAAGAVARPRLTAKLLTLAGAGTLAVGTGSGLVAMAAARRLGAGRPGLIGLLAATGAVAGAAALGWSQRDRLALVQRAAGDGIPLRQAGTILRNARHPWLANEVLDSMQDTNRVALGRFGTVELDGRADAFQHAYGSALLLGRLRHDHGLDADSARRIAEQVGTAHEDDRSRDPANDSRRMDLFNNAAGHELAMRLLAEGAWDEDALAEQVSDLLTSGQLRTVVDGDLVPTL